MANVGAVPSNREWTKRRVAAEAYRPKTIRLLLIAEAPPEDLRHYFYFDEDVANDGLFRGICEVLFEAPPTGSKQPWLRELRRRGVFLIDLRPDAPVGAAKLADYADWLLLRLEEFQSQHIVLVQPSVHSAAYRRLAAARLPVSDVRIPVPDRGHEVDFRREFRTALIRAGLEKLIRPLPESKPKSPKTVVEPTPETQAQPEAKSEPKAPPPPKPRLKPKPKPKSKPKSKR